MKEIIDQVKRFKEAIDKIEKDKAEALIFIQNTYVPYSEAHKAATAAAQAEYRDAIEKAKEGAKTEALKELAKIKGMIYKIVSAPLPAGANEMLAHYAGMSKAEREIMADKYKGNYTAERLIAMQEHEHFEAVDSLLKDFEDIETELGYFFDLKHGSKSYAFLNIASGFPLEILAERVKIFMDKYTA